MQIQAIKSFLITKYHIYVIKPSEIFVSSAAKPTRKIYSSLNTTKFKHRSTQWSIHFVKSANTFIKLMVLERFHFFLFLLCSLLRFTLWSSQTLRKPHWQAVLFLEQLNIRKWSTKWNRRSRCRSMFSTNVHLVCIPLDWIYCLKPGEVQCQALMSYRSYFLVVWYLYQNYTQCTAL